MVPQQKTTDPLQPFVTPQTADNMKFQQIVLSIIVTVGSKSYSILSRCGKYSSAPLVLFFCGSILFAVDISRRQRQRPPSETRGISQRDIFAAVVVAVASIVYFNTYGGDEEHLRLFEERNRIINEYYDINPNKHLLSPERTIPPSSIQYVDGQWLILNQDAADKSDDASVIRFRGINLPAKTPSIPTHLRNTHNSTNFYETKQNISFVGCPFSLEEAPEHFRRISHHWGFNLVRLSVSWEAVMHEGPGIVDESYLEYVKELVMLAAEFGLYVIIDPHQDVWSRFTGGDGAPWWTLDAVGFSTDDSSLHDTGSAVLHQFWNTTEYGEMPRMLWTFNYWRLAAATMFTLFFAGDDFASGIVTDSMKLPRNFDDATTTNLTMQQFLQGHYLDYLDAVANELKECNNVIGFGAMNEPSSGFIGISHLNDIAMPSLHGHVLSTFDSMRLGSGDSLKVPYYKSHYHFDSLSQLNPNGRSAYKSSNDDIWKRVGVYDIDAQTSERVVLRPDHFALGQREDFLTKYLIPFFDAVRGTVTKSNPRFLTYAEPAFDPTDPYPTTPFALLEHPNHTQFGWAPHWYDAVTLFLQRYNHWVGFNFDWMIPVVTPFAIDFTFKRYLKRIKDQKYLGTDHKMSICIGETGVPFSASQQDSIRSLDRTLKAMESCDLDYAIWTYEAGNNEAEGDRWNNENLSLFSGGKSRGVMSAVRPYVFQYSKGLEVTLQEFNPFKMTYKLTFLDSINCHECNVTAVLYVPSCHFPDAKIAASGDLVHDQSRQSLKWNLFGRKAGSTYDLSIETTV